MKGLQRFRDKKTGNRQSTIIKRTQQQLRKELFFNQLITDVQEQFTQHQMQLFLAFIEYNHFHSWKAKPRQFDNCNYPSHLNFQTSQEEANNEPIFKIEANIFGEVKERKCPIRMSLNDTDRRAHLNTPKYRGKMSQRCLLNGMMLNINNKMKKDYTHSREIPMIKNRYDAFAENNQTSQVKMRYQTQCQENIKSDQISSVPLILMKERWSKATIQRQYDKQCLQQKRKQCFVGKWASAQTSPRLGSSRYHLHI